MRRAILALGGLALAATIAACGTATGADPSGPPPSIDGNVTKVSATGMAFDQDQVLAPAGKPFSVTFDNAAGTAPHNVAIKDPSGKEVFNGDIVDPGKATTYAVPALAAGTYSFVCSLHSDMRGTIVIK